MENLDQQLLPKPYGLVNTGCICYFNSFIQAFTSCSSLNKYVLSKKDFADDPVMRHYYNLLEVSTNMFDMQQNVVNLAEMQSALVEYVRKTAKSTSRDRLAFGHGQEDSQEALILFLELLGEPVEDFLCVRYYEVLECTHCHFSQSRLNADRRVKESQTFLRITPDRFAAFNNDFGDAIKGHKELMHDYVCDKCSHKNTTVLHTAVSRLSAVIIILMDKYMGPVQVHLPKSFSIGAKGQTTLNYTLVAAIDHSGDRSSGHYIAQVTRNAHGTGKYLANDTSVVPMGELMISPNTYVAFYHRES